ncbi:MAG: hypothetical protein J7K75_06520, partial [Desulfuromonas sp.]|nr:hypothetical protein [Desulfuromonas sp.]
KEFSDLGDLIAVDGSLITATMSMLWADYRNGANKAKVHLGFDIGRGVPQKVTLTDGAYSGVIRSPIPLQSGPPVPG